MRVFSFGLFLIFVTICLSINISAQDWEKAIQRLPRETGVNAESISGRKVIQRQAEGDSGESPQSKSKKSKVTKVVLQVLIIGASTYGSETLADRFNNPILKILTIGAGHYSGEILADRVGGNR